MLICGLLLLTAIVHPFHVTYAEAQWNRNGSRLQVALRMSPMDLDNALSKANGRRVLLEKESSEAKRALVESYLRDTIYLAASKTTASKPTASKATASKTTASKPTASKTAGSLAREQPSDLQQQPQQRFHWVGLEDEVRYTWVYFELEVPDEVANAEDQSDVKETGQRKYWLHHRVFFEIEETQINTLQLLKTDPAIAVRTSRQEPAKLLPVVLPVAEAEGRSVKAVGKQ